jgi:hypothetical protein
MRQPGFPITFASGRGDSIVISLRTADHHPARALEEAGILRSSIVAFAQALITAQGRRDPRQSMWRPRPGVSSPSLCRMRS